MTIQLGRFGIWKRAADTTPAIAREVEELGYGALWLGGSPDGQLLVVDDLLDATEELPVATGIVNIWRSDPATVAGSYHRINDRHPDRFLLGIGIGHPESTSEYRRPYQTIVEYLESLSGAGVPSEHLVLAALGPRVLRLSAERTAGAHPYLTTPRHTRAARALLGEEAMLAPEQTVAVGSDPDQARELARDFVRRYLELVNYRENLLREGWSDDDVANGGSDRLVDELVLSGPAASVAPRLGAHLEAGADHVTIQALGTDASSAHRALAEVLFS